MPMISEMLQAGWALLPIPRGQKGPVHSGWNLPSGCITSVDSQQGLEGLNIGLAHAYCTPTPTCAIDIDNYKTAKPWLAMHGIELDALLNTPGAVLISSGRNLRIKLLYRLPTNSAPLESKKIVGPDGQTALEFRCATKDGKTVQDVLPPSRHPDGRDYVWVGDGNPLLIPEIPEELAKVWHTLISNSSRAAIRRTHTPTTRHQLPETPRQIAIIQAALAHISADCDYDRWLKIVFAVQSTCWMSAEDIALTWSKTAPHRFDEEAFWVLAHSFIPDHPSQITVGTLYYYAGLGGWK